MALDDTEAGVEHIKLVVLMVLWNQGQPLDTLILDELLGRSGPVRCTESLRAPAFNAVGLAQPV